MHGGGIQTWPDGREYVGEWRNGKMHGGGTLTWPDGKKYVGEWKEGEPYEKAKSVKKPEKNL